MLYSFICFFKKKVYLYTSCQYIYIYRKVYMVTHHFLKKISEKKQSLYGNPSLFNKGTKSF